MPRRSGGGGRSMGGGGFSRGGSGFGGFSSRPRSSSPYRSSRPAQSSFGSRTGSSAAAPTRTPFTNPNHGQSRMGMGMPGIGSALGMGMALGAGSAIGHTAMNSLFGGGGRGGYGMEPGMGGGMGGAMAPPMGMEAAPAYGSDLVDYATRDSLTPEQINQKMLEEQQKVDPCFQSTGTLLNCLRDNAENIGTCQTQMNEMVSCQKQAAAQQQYTNMDQTNSMPSSMRSIQ